VTDSSPQAESTVFQSMRIPIPSRRLMAMAGILFALAVLSLRIEAVHVLFLIGSAAAAGAVLLDLVMLWWLPKPEMKREFPAQFALGCLHDVRLRILHRGGQPLVVRLFDGIPPAAAVEDFPWVGELSARGETMIIYPMRVNARGRHRIEPAWALLQSPFGLWYRRERIGETDEIRVFPNFAPVLRYALLAMSDRLDSMGIQQRARTGNSREFRQLREYREGDSLSQIDWKATARKRSLVSREYAEQRDQTVVFLLDSGRRMRASDQGLPQFDHCLNAVLLLSYIALRQGDRVGIMRFGSACHWFPPVKGPHAMPEILENLFEAETEPVPVDYDEAAAQLLMMQKRRAMVVLLTNLRGETCDDLAGPLGQLAVRHLVFLASLREESIEALREIDSDHSESLLASAAAHLYHADRMKTLADLGNYGVHVLDSTASKLPVALANRYLEVKARGLL